MAIIQLKYLRENFIITKKLFDLTLKNTKINCRRFADFKMIESILIRESAVKINSERLESCCEVNFRYLH